MAEWTRIVPALAAAGLLCAVDRALLSLYCVAWERFRAAHLDLLTQSPLAVTPAGYVVQSVYLSNANRAAADLRKAIAELGISPVARRRQRPASKPAHERQLPPPVRPDLELAFQEQELLDTCCPSTKRRRKLDSELPQPAE